MIRYKKAEESGQLEDALKYKKSSVYVNQKMKEDAKKMLQLLGVPVIQVDQSSN